MPSRVADILMEAARQQGEAIRERGAIWGNALAQVGQIPGQVIQQQQQGELRKTQLAGEKQAQQYRGMQMSSMAAAQESEQTARKLIGGGLPRDERGDYDIPAALEMFAKGNVDTARTEQIGKFLETSNELRQKARQRKIDDAAEMAHSVLDSHQHGPLKGQPYDMDEVMIPLHDALDRGDIDQKTADMFTKHLSDGGDIEQLLRRIRSGGSRFKDIEKPVPRTEWGLVNPQTGEEVVAPAAPKEEWQTKDTLQALDEKSQPVPGVVEHNPKTGQFRFNGQPIEPTRLREKPKESTSEFGQMQNTYAGLVLKKPGAMWDQLTPEQQQAGIKQIEKWKADPAAARQAAAFEQQNSLEATRERNRQADIGRKELQDKVEVRWRDAQQKADLTRELVQSARSGNQIAGSVQMLGGTLMFTTAEGVKRINQSEINSFAGAGSVWERIKSTLSSGLTGQKLSDKLSHDLESLGDIIERGAKKRYRDEFKSTVDRYKLEGEKPLPGTEEVQTPLEPNPIAPNITPRLQKRLEGS